MAMRNPIRAAFDQGAAPTITLVNLATTDLGVNFEALVKALQTFVTKCFVPVWGTPATLTTGTWPEVGTWSLVFLDSADAPNALGYHDLTKNGLPLSKVFVEPTLAAGGKVSVTACHEICEMLVDPAINLWSDGPDGKLYAYEMCDAVEEEEFLINGIAMSDFVYPSYFELFREPNSTQFDYLKKVSAPFQILSGGYSLIREGAEIKEVFGSSAKRRRFAQEDRTEHRSEYRKALLKLQPENSAHLTPLPEAGEFDEPDIPQEIVQPSYGGISNDSEAKLLGRDTELAVECGHLISAAYEMSGGSLTPSPGPGFPKEYELIAWVQMSDFLLQQTYPSFYGFIARKVNDPANTVLAIRGTEGFVEWIDDAVSVSLVPFKSLSCGAVGQGFARIYETLEVVEVSNGESAAAAPRAHSLFKVGGFYEQVEDLLARRSSNSALRAAGKAAAPSLRVAGHSLGAALATLYAMENGLKGGVDTLSVCLFASPRVGDLEFVNAFGNLGIKTWNIINPPDIVPKLPLFGFEHVGSIIDLPTVPNVKPSLGCWHSLRTYLSLLDNSEPLDPNCGTARVAEFARIKRGSFTLPVGQSGTPFSLPIEASEIVALAEQSSIISYPWKNRGVAPRGYIKGLAVLYAELYSRLLANEAAAVALARPVDVENKDDALAWYAQQFGRAGLGSFGSPAGRLRNLFVLLTGLGMRESSGRYCEGRDITAGNTSADNAEAGLFQVSFDLLENHADMLAIFDRYQADPSGYQDIFKECPPCGPAQWKNYGSAQDPGYTFQDLTKKCPAFAVEIAASGLRFKKGHWGPIVRFEAEVRKECSDLFLAVEKAVDAASSAPQAPVPPAAAQTLPGEFGFHIAMASLDPSLPIRALRIGSRGLLVKAWQNFLSGQGFDPGTVDGVFAERTEAATKEFQVAHGLKQDGVAGRQTLLKAMELGFELIEEPDQNNSGSNFPPRPSFPSLQSTRQRWALFGHFDYVPAPLPDDRENIRILGSWEATNIIKVPIPQLSRTSIRRPPEFIRFHKLAASQLMALWQAWDTAGLLNLVLTFDGSFVPRFKRGQAGGGDEALSNHSFGSAFDINEPYNKFGQRPALVGEEGCVRELVAIANAHGFYWGGHFNDRLDGMHFEIAYLTP